MGYVILPCSNWKNKCFFAFTKFALISYLRFQSSRIQMDCGGGGAFCHPPPPQCELRLSARGGESGCHSHCFWLMDCAARQTSAAAQCTISEGGARCVSSHLVTAQLTSALIVISDTGGRHLSFILIAQLFI